MPEKVKDYADDGVSCRHNSLPHTDLAAQALFMVDAGPKGKANPLELLVIVNPDREARRRIRSVLSRRISNTTRVVVFDYLKEFARFIEPED